jgi:penicillin-binding protein 1A
MIKKAIRYLVFLVIAVTVGFVLFVVSVNYEVFGHLYSKKELKDFKNQTATRIFTKDDVLIGKFFAKNRTNITYDQIPAHVVNALVATEDVRYFEHEGVDSRSLIRVLFKTILMNERSSGGGSTITQQLLKNMYGRKNFGPLTMLVNKTKEGLLAHRLETIYNKEEILALYLNTIPFGENVYGIESASRLFYNKSVTDLSMDQGAVLVGMLKANTYYNPRLYPDHSFTRRNVVFGQMLKYEYLNQSEFDSLTQVSIVLDYANLESSGPANYFLVQVKRELKDILEIIEKKTGKQWDYRTDGLVVETTMDFKLQTFAMNSFKKHLKVMQQRLRTQYASGASLKYLNKKSSKIITQNKWDKNTLVKREVFGWDSTYYDSVTVLDSLKYALTTLQAGFLAIQPKSGEILAWVGGIDFRTQPFDQILAKRQMASTFKPILYAAALEKGMQPCDYLNNTAQTYTDFDNWKPANYDHSEGGKYSLTGALIKSKNVPTVDLLFKVGFDEVDYLWRKMGFKSHLNHSPAMALGTADASLYELAIAYSAFANGGFEISPRTIRSIKTTDGTVIYEREEQELMVEVLEPRSAILMNQMLQKAINQGTGVSVRNKYAVTIPLAGKTGTSQNFGDAWFAAYNPSVVMVTRVGASSSKIHFNSGANGSGGRLALPITALTLQQIQNNKEELSVYSKSFEPLPSQYASELNCPDFMEDSAMDKFKDFFKSDKTTTEKKQKKSNITKDKEKLKKEKKKKRKGWFKKK